jgi:hypothetical protein
MGPVGGSGAGGASAGAGGAGGGSVDGGVDSGDAGALVERINGQVCVAQSLDEVPAHCQHHELASDARVAVVGSTVTPATVDTTTGAFTITLPQPVVDADLDFTQARVVDNAATSVTGSGTVSATVWTMDDDMLSLALVSSGIQRLSGRGIVMAYVVDSSNHPLQNVTATNTPVAPYYDFSIDRVVSTPPTGMIGLILMPNVPPGLHTFSVMPSMTSGLKTAQVVVSVRADRVHVLVVQLTPN